MSDDNDNDNDNDNDKKGGEVIEDGKMGFALAHVKASMQRLEHTVNVELMARYLLSHDPLLIDRMEILTTELDSINEELGQDIGVQITNAQYKIEHGFYPWEHDDYVDEEGPPPVSEIEPVNRESLPAMGTALGMEWQRMDELFKQAAELADTAQDPDGRAYWKDKMGYICDHLTETNQWLEKLVLRGQQVDWKDRKKK